MTTRSICPTMRACALFLLFAVIPATLVAQRTSTDYKGVMGGTKKISMHLDTEIEQLDEDGDLVHMIQYSGYYSYGSSRKQIPLYGSSKHFPEFGELLPPLMLQEEVGGELTGTFHGQFAPDGSFIGFWGDPDSTQALPFVLYPVGAGADAAQRELKALMAFLNRFREALQKQDEGKIASMIQFPLTVSEGVIGQEEMIIDRKAFSKYRGRLFYTPEARARIAEVDAGDFYPSVSFSNSEKGIPDGTSIYFMYVGFDIGKKRTIASFGFGRIDGTYKLLVVN